VALFRIRDLERRADIITRSESRRKFKTADTILREDARDTLDAASFDIFLSHSYLNADDVLALKAEIESMDFGVYVDWVVDSHTNREDVTKETADLIRERMGQCKSLFYVTSSEAADSKWMPWELGYFDGKKQKVAILPVLKSDRVTDSYSGQEYLGLYPYVTRDKRENGGETLWIHETGNCYITFEGWLAGKRPREH
jgi:hypothetical protein